MGQYLVMAAEVIDMDEGKAGNTMEVVEVLVLMANNPVITTGAFFHRAFTLTTPISATNIPHKTCNRNMAHNSPNTVVGADRLNMAEVHQTPTLTC